MLTNYNKTLTFSKNIVYSIGMIDYCYHTHTARCGHATGTEEEYIQSAIKNGLKVIGFTDHVFLPGIDQPGMRGSYQELDDYISTINKLKEKYKDQIEIHLGFECEYGKRFEEYYQSLLKEKGIEYLILGQHLFFNNDGTLKWLFSYENPDEALERYVDQIIEGLKTGLFTYVAHPDLFIRYYSEITPFVDNQIRKLCRACAEYDAPLEINLGGLRFKQYLREGKINYASEEFFKIASEYPIKVIVGVDAHDPNDFNDGVSDYDFAENLIKKYHLNHIKRLAIKKQSI